jgi:hypothetical protein
MNPCNPTLLPATWRREVLRSMRLAKASIAPARWLPKDLARVTLRDRLEQLQPFTAAVSPDRQAPPPMGPRPDRSPGPHRTITEPYRKPWKNAAQEVSVIQGFSHAG